MMQEIISIAFVVFVFVLFLWFMYDAPLVDEGRDLPLDNKLKDIDDPKLSYKEKEFYKQVKKHRDGKEN